MLIGVVGHHPFEDAEDFHNRLTVCVAGIRKESLRFFERSEDAPLHIQFSLEVLAMRGLSGPQRLREGRLQSLRQFADRIFGTHFGLMTPARPPHGSLSGGHLVAWSCVARARRHLLAWGPGGARARRHLMAWGHRLTSGRRIVRAFGRRGAFWRVRVYEFHAARQLDSSLRSVHRTEC